MKNGKRRILIVAGLTLAVVILLAFFGFCLYQFETLQLAHSSFENYYNFRGCIHLINKTSTYGYCSLASGQIIKLVEYNGRWYLDGDLQCSGFCW